LHIGKISLGETPLGKYLTLSLIGTSYSIQRYKVRERKGQTRETSARGVYGEYTPLHTNGKEINGATRNIEGLH